MPLRISLGLENLTWEQLIAFVDTARTSVGPHDAVTVEDDDQGYPLGLSVQLRPDLASGPPVVIDHDEAVGWADVIDAAKDSDGDARAELGQLIKLRDHLLHLPR